MIIVIIVVSVYNVIIVTNALTANSVIIVIIVVVVKNVTIVINVLNVNNVIIVNIVFVVIIYRMLNINIIIFNIQKKNI